MAFYPTLRLLLERLRSRVHLRLPWLFLVGKNEVFDGSVVRVANDLRRQHLGDAERRRLLLDQFVRADGGSPGACAFPRQHQRLRESTPDLPAQPKPLCHGARAQAL